MKPRQTLRNYGVGGLFAGVALLLTACASTQALNSMRLGSSTEPIKAVRVLYVDSTLKMQGSGRSNEMPWVLKKVGYDKLGDILRQRVPVVFAANGIDAVFATSKAGWSPFGAGEPIQWDGKASMTEPILVLQMVNGSTFTYGSTNVYLNLQAQLLNSTGRGHLWVAHFQNTMTARLIGTSGVDEEFVDGMMKSVIDQMAKDGLVKLPGAEAVLPSKVDGRNAATKQ